MFHLVASTNMSLKMLLQIFCGNYGKFIIINIICKLCIQINLYKVNIKAYVKIIFTIINLHFKKMFHLVEFIRINSSIRMSLKY